MEPQRISIHFAEDDGDDRLMAQDAVAEAKLAATLSFSVDGQDLLDYLQRRGEYAALAHQPLPDIVMLDLNMPRKDGRECIREIRADEKLKHLPVVVLTTSDADRDVLESYRLGVNSYITKPVTFDAMIATLQSVYDYWTRISRLPRDSG